MGHAVHAEAPAAAYVPPGKPPMQFVHAVDPEDEENEPAGQGVHPTPLLYVPARQMLQADEPTTLYVPAGHAVQVWFLPVDDE